MDFLFQYNTIQRDKLKGLSSRSWNPTLVQWTTDYAESGQFGAEKTGTFFDLKEQEEQQEDLEEEASFVQVDEAIPKCRICGEAFEKVWNEEEEEWVYK